MNKTALVSTSVFMALVALFFLGESHRQISGSENYEKIANFWKQQVGNEQLKRLVLASHFAQFKQEVAIHLPGYLDGSGAESAPLRSLASVIPRHHTSDIDLNESAEQMLAQGKAAIKKRDYGKGIQILKKLMISHPDSLHQVEAHYLLVEAYHQQDNYGLVLQWTEKMVELYPENPLTGYALLKAGLAYERDGRFENAMDVYRTVVSAYSEKGLIERAQKAAKQLEL